MTMTQWVIRRYSAATANRRNSVVRRFHHIDLQVNQRPHALIVDDIMTNDNIN